MYHFLKYFGVTLPIHKSVIKA
uniref:Uncharacterized protein n=1 Tax=Anguilla anguilla TaxID=7936 RepID=A0A0E9UJ11_ANGAN